MERWKKDFIMGLKAGKPAEACARLYAGMSLARVHELRELDPDFAGAWDAVSEPDEVIDGAVIRRALTPGALEAILWAQCSDEMAAAYFGLRTEEFTVRVSDDAALKEVYETARTGGRAALQKAQFEAAMSGDRTMLTWLGKQHLGQADKVEHNGALALGDSQAKITINNIILRTLTQEQLEAISEQASGIGEQFIIEGQAEEVK